MQKIYRSYLVYIYQHLWCYSKRGLEPPKQGGSHRTTEDVASPLSAFTPSAAVDDLEQSILAPLGLPQLLFQLPDLFLSLRSRLLGPAATTSSSSVIASRRAGGGEGAKISSSDANKRLARSRSTSWTPVGSLKGWSEKLGCGACTKVRLWHARDAVQQAGEGAEPPSRDYLGPAGRGRSVLWISRQPLRRVWFWRTCRRWHLGCCGSRVATGGRLWLKVVSVGIRNRTVRFCCHAAVSRVGDGNCSATPSLSDFSGPRPGGRTAKCVPFSILRNYRKLRR